MPCPSMSDLRWINNRMTLVMTLTDIAGSSSTAGAATPWNAGTPSLLLRQTP